ncbi:hypothetical protein LWM68_32555 [Niabella sp. W65]|nr:hypothetical protein [Niabella sp. W65]MCH7367078.1 hypothetical protein [Niabella sp. W65]ULT42756.1 hypothetical protein KRR40_04085 [Niabella sp. I65]
MKKLQLIKTITLLTLSYLTGSIPLMAQEPASATGSSSFTLDANSVLVFAVAILAMVIAVLGYTLRASLDLYKKEKTIRISPGRW